MVKIGNVRIQGKTVLAPMCSISTLPFRILCKRYGAALVFTEMISAEGEKYKDYRLKKGFYTKDEERPVAVQIFGARPDVLTESAHTMEKLKADIIDINMGCPSIKLSRNNAGAIILKNEKLVKEIISTVSSTVKCPVTAKIRLGVYSSDNTVKLAKIIEKAGASAITLHARTMKQKYSGDADWDMIKKVKDAVGIPVIGNGDVFSAIDAKEIINKTNCDLVMIGRGAIGNPFIFKQCEHYLKTGELLPEITAKDKFIAYKTLAGLMEKHSAETPKLKDYKVNACWFTKNLAGGREARMALAGCKTKDDILNVLSGLCD